MEKGKRRLWNLTSEGKKEDRQPPEAKEEEWYEKDVQHSIALALNLGFSIALPIAGGIVIGKIIDTRLGQSPRFTLIFLGLGIFVGISYLLVLIRENSGTRERKTNR